MDEPRPPLTPELSGAELLRWYWLKDELVRLARDLGVSTAGGKQELTERLAAELDGRPLPTVTRAGAAGRQLTGELTVETVIPPGQRCSQLLRNFFVQQFGAAFRFDGPLRQFIAEGAGRTLGEAVSFHRTTRGRQPGEIGAQFELNRFLRDWHLAHPDGSRAEALQAWRSFGRCRSTPAGDSRWVQVDRRIPRNHKIAVPARHSDGVKKLYGRRRGTELLIREHQGRRGSDSALPRSANGRDD